MEKNTTNEIFTIMLALIADAEPILEQMGNQEALTIANELRSSLIAYLYLKKQSEEDPDSLVQVKSLLQSVKLLPLIESKTREFNEVLAKMREA